ncbi:GtrA family protein [Pedobacter sp. KR3-3]|uniref:GtrA family protein n=1 Tax=Pedobacter albus TaxID=3113905 RepID=A0ABU7IBC6_9SPHI|nr:GtrA family protein [Pedobacter sp. KR3-3]MEE1946795.1 GtrA family protein [Pedobacter sp. KR3-3]
MDITRLTTLTANKKIQQFFKFGLVGFSGLAIDFVMTYLLKDQLHIDQYLANTIGFGTAVINNYLLNKIWTFKNKDKNHAKQFIRFALIATIGLCLNTLCILGLQQLHIPFYPAKLMAIAVVFVWNFTANATITFKEH